MGRSCEWFQKFKNGEFFIEDKERSGRPKVYEDAEWQARIMIPAPILIKNDGNLCVHLIQLFNVCILCNIWLKISNYILHQLNVKNPKSEETRFECQKSDIRLDAFRMSNIWHSTVRPIELKKFDLTMRRIESNLLHSIRQNAHVYLQYDFKLLVGVVSECESFRRSWNGIHLTKLFM